MLHTFISSRSARSGNVAGALLSTLFHGGLIGLAVSATAVPVHYHMEGGQARPEHLHFVNAARVVRAAPHAATQGARVAASHAMSLAHMLQNLQAVHLAFDVDVPAASAEPAIDYGGMARSGLTFVDSADGDVLHPVVVPGRVYTDRNVERSVMPRDGNPKPRYPAFLEQIGVGAALTVRFVVDTSGVVEDHTMEFPPEAHRMFVDAVRKALRRSRFWPALLAGQRVPQLVEQTFIFRMAP